MVSVDHSFAEMERVNNEKAFTYRGPEDMSQDLPANCSMDSPEGTGELLSTYVLAEGWF